MPSEREKGRRIGFYSQLGNTGLPFWRCCSSAMSSRLLSVAVIACSHKAGRGSGLNRAREARFTSALSSGPLQGEGLLRTHSKGSLSHFQGETATADRGRTWASDRELVSEHAICRLISMRSGAGAGPCTWEALRLT